MTLKHRMKLALAKLSWERNDNRAVVTMKREKETMKKRVVDRGQRVVNDDTLTEKIETALDRIRDDIRSYHDTSNEGVAAQAVLKEKEKTLEWVLAQMYGEK